MQWFGPKSWVSVAKFVPGRNDIQCRERSVRSFRGHVVCAERCLPFMFTHNTLINTISISEFDAQSTRHSRQLRVRSVSSNIPRVKMIVGTRAFSVVAPTL